MTHRIAIICGLVATMLIAMQGCYTMIKHPRLDYTERDKEYLGGHCQECHEDYGEFPYGYSSVHYPEYWREYHRWGEYYAIPWWQVTYWKGSDSQTPADSEDDAVERRRGLPNYENPNSGLAPAVIDNPIPPSTGNNGQTITGDDEGKTKDEPKRDQPQQTPDIQKPERRRLPSQGE